MDVHPTAGRCWVALCRHERRTADPFDFDASPHLLDASSLGVAAVHDLRLLYHRRRYLIVGGLLTIL
ncbi:hypothetical protein PR202_gb22951 [Eleusine coracana subsp. coracana]|uniref:Uncharacterized protein n=1 Tax=Eleusine coracana subsp. coracana TaxID=191504 RepID=A0AAV5FI66_ELECO|nr:hypothetical protein PR202_gb22951 [Eleusine coracana subsp. coracana]